MGLAGAGQGEGTGMRLMAAGVAGRLARTRGMRLGYQADGFWLGMDREIGVRRLRAGLEGSVVLREVMEPYVEAALLHSAGDAERGLGMEAGGGMRVRMGVLQAEVMTRRLVVQAEEGAGEWGYAGCCVMEGWREWGCRCGHRGAYACRVAMAAGASVGGVWLGWADGCRAGLWCAGGWSQCIAAACGSRVARERPGLPNRSGSAGAEGIGFSMSGMAMEHIVPYQPVHYGVTASGYVRW